VNPPSTPRVQATPVEDGNGETLQGGVELVAAARHETPVIADDDDGIALGHQTRRLVGHRAGDEDGAPGDEVMGVGS